MLTILVGMSGSGKDAIQKELVNPDNQYNTERLVTATTRPMREGEQDGIDYHFMSREDFLKSVEAENFIEHRSYHTLVEGKPDTWYYGSLKKELDPEKDYCIILDVQGAKDFVEYYGKENCFVVEIVVRDDIREQRAMARGSFDKTEWDRRLDDDRVKFSPAQTESVVNYTIDNSFGDVDDAVCDLLDAFEAYVAYEKEADKLYRVYAEQSNYGYYDPPETVYKVYDVEELKKARRAELELEIEEGLQSYINDMLENSHTLPERAFSVSFVSLEHGDEGDGRLFNAMVDVSYDDGLGNLESAVFVVSPFPDGNVLVCSMGLTDDEMAIGQALPFKSFLDEYEKTLEDSIREAVTNWAKEDINFAIFCKNIFAEEYGGYSIAFGNESEMKPLNALSEAEWYRLSAEIASLRLGEGVGLSDEQKAFLGDNFNAFYQSEIQISRNGSGAVNDSDDKLFLVELFTDELAEIHKLASYMSQGYSPELPAISKEHNKTDVAPALE